MAGKHAICSPSGASGWMNCASWEGNSGSSIYSREGTAAHSLAANCLTSGKDAITFLGDKIEADGQEFTVTKEMAGHVQKYVDIIRSIKGDLYVEQSLPLENVTGEKDAEGTTDAVILMIDQQEIFIGDFKFGYGEVNAEENEQLQNYALSALEKFSFGDEFKQARLMIIQPRINNYSEWTISIEDLRKFGERVKTAAAKKLAGVEEYNPGTKQCEWCAKKRSCPALKSFVTEATAQQFDIVSDEIPPETLDLIEQWVSAKYAEYSERLYKGESLQHWKLVAGKRGNRAWKDKLEAEATLKAMRFKKEEMYDFSVISPTDAEKLMKENPRKWNKVKDLIVQPDGKPTLVSIKDKKPALTMVKPEDGFEIINNEGE